MTFHKKQRESTLERWCVRWARSNNIITSKLTDPTGIFDHVLWMPGGRPVLLEFKDPSAITNKDRHKLQTYYATYFAGVGYTVMRVSSKDQFLEAMMNTVRNEVGV